MVLCITSGDVFLNWPHRRCAWPGRNTGLSTSVFGDAGLLLGQRLDVVEAADEQQVGDLLDDLQRVADAAGPEGVPDAVDLALQLTRDHRGDSMTGEGPGVDMADLLPRAVPGAADGLSTRRTSRRRTFRTGVATRGRFRPWGLTASDAVSRRPTHSPCPPPSQAGSSRSTAPSPLGRITLRIKVDRSGGSSTPGRSETGDGARRDEVEKQDRSGRSGRSLFLVCSRFRYRFPNNRL